MAFRCIQELRTHEQHQKCKFETCYLNIVFQIFTYMCMITNVLFCDREYKLWFLSMPFETTSKDPQGCWIIDKIFQMVLLLYLHAIPELENKQTIKAKNVRCRLGGQCGLYWRSKIVFIKRYAYAEIPRRWLFEGQSSSISRRQDWRCTLMEKYSRALTAHLLWLKLFPGVHIFCVSARMPPALRLNPVPLHLLINFLTNRKTFLHFRDQELFLFATVWLSFHIWS